MNINPNKSSFHLYRGPEEVKPESANQKNKSEANIVLSEMNKNTLENFDPLQAISFGQRQGVSSAIREHSDEYICLHCNSKYNGSMKCCDQNKMMEEENSSNQNDLSEQSRQKIYKCPYEHCPKTFNLESGLIRHKIVHTGEKPYICDFDECDQSFNQKSNLNRHKKIHKNEKPFICDKCCKAFTTTTNLKQHSQVHLPKKADRKVFVCEFKGCNKQYLYRCNLKKHKQEHMSNQSNSGNESIKKEQIGQNESRKAEFRVSVENCEVSLYICSPTTEDPSQIKIGYDDSVVSDGEIYEADRIVPKEIEDLKNQKKQESTEDVILRNLEGIFGNKSISTSASFYIHPFLVDYAKILLPQITYLLQEKGCQQIRFFVESPLDFRSCAIVLMEEFLRN